MSSGVQILKIAYPLQSLNKKPIVGKKKTQNAVTMMLLLIEAVTRSISVAR